MRAVGLILQGASGGQTWTRRGVDSVSDTTALALSATGVEDEDEAERKARNEGDGVNDGMQGFLIGG